VRSQPNPEEEGPASVSFQSTASGRPAVSSTGPEPSSVSFATSLGTGSLSTETTLQPEEAEDEAVNELWPLRRSRMGRTPIIL